MFAKFTILVWCLPLVVYVLDNDFAEFWVKIAIISCYSLALIVLYVIYLLRVDIVVESGKAPVERLNIAYKFLPPSEKESDLSKDVRKAWKQYSGLKRIFFYYTTSDVIQLGCAGGIVLSDEIANDAAQKKSLVKAGFRLLSTPPVSYAVFSEYPVMPWFPITQWLACYRTYPRIHRYCEKHNLSAYPMIEIYDRKSVLFFAPLSRQDAFVVPEAEDIITRAKIKLEELEQEASGSEASNSDVSDEESVSARSASARSASVRSGSSRSVSTRSSVRGSTRSVSTHSSAPGSTVSAISRTTTWSYHSTYDKFSDDECAEMRDDKKADRKGEGFFRRSMSSCARTVKNMLGFEADSDKTLNGDAPIVDDSAETPELNRSKSVDDIVEKPRENQGALRRSVSKIASALNFIRSSAPQAAGTVDKSGDVPSTSCAAEIKLEIKTADSAQCGSPCGQNGFQVPTVSLVGA